MFPAAVVDRAAVEAAALRIAGSLPGVPVPVVQESGSLDAAEPVSYLTAGWTPRLGIGSPCTRTLHLVQERAWIAVDRPQGWQGSLSELGQVLSTLPVP